jgi:hypothetical protein
MSDFPKRYLGDGAYVAFDGYSLILTAENASAPRTRSSWSRASTQSSCASWPT